MEKYTLQSFVNGKEITVEFELKFLTNELRTKLFNLDAEYQKKFHSEFKNSKVAKMQKDLTEKIKEVETNAKELTLEQKNAIINQLYLKFVSDLGDEKMIEENKDYTIKTWKLKDEKDIDTLKLIINTYKLDDEVTLDYTNSETQSEFWMNCDIEKVGEIVNSFRTKYKITG